MCAMTFTSNVLVSVLKRVCMSCLLFLKCLMYICCPLVYHVLHFTCSPAPGTVMTSAESRFLSLFGRCLAVDATRLLAIIELFFMFHLFCLVFTLTWFQFPNYMLYMFPLFPPCPCRELFIVSTCALCDWCIMGFVFFFIFVCR